MKNLFIQHTDQLKNLLRYGVLRSEVLESPGLYNGKLGMAILFYEYSRYSGDTLYEQFADEILDSILDLPASLSFRFSDGLTGIGWGITYLLKEKFIEGEIDDILSEIDIKLKKIDPLDKTLAVDHAVYLNMRTNYTKQEPKGSLINPIFNEDKILKQIWKNCFYPIPRKLS